MASSLNFRRIGLALLAAIASLPPAVRAKEFVSNQYGFQISIPVGFREQHSDVLNVIVEYVEAQSEVGSYPITIDIRHTGPKYNPADKTAISFLPRQKGWTSTLETRRWKDMDLQVVRQEIAVSSTQVYVSYTIIFPLTDEGIVLVVQGLKSREKEVLKVFENCIQKFVNLKPYVTVAASAQSGEDTHSVAQVLANILLPVVTGALVLFWFAKVRKAKSKKV